MSSTTKVVIWIVVIVAIILGGFFYFSQSNQSAVPAGSASQTSPSDQSQTPAYGANGGTGVSATDTSDAALDSDMSNVDGQMNDLKGDSANADAGINATSTQ